VRELDAGLDHASGHVVLKEEWQVQRNDYQEPHENVQCKRIVKVTELPEEFDQLANDVVDWLE
jgi:hypothetical protein